MKDFTRARQLWQQGNIHKAIHLYQKVASQKDATEQQRNMAIYMIAYLFILEAKQLKNEMAVLGVDLTHPHHDYYYKAALCLRRITAINFNAVVLDLPEINTLDMEIMEEAYQQRSYTNRCVNDFLPKAWSFDYKVYLQMLFTNMAHLFSTKTHKIAKI